MEANVACIFEGYPFNAMIKRRRRRKNYRFYTENLRCSSVFFFKKKQLHKFTNDNLVSNWQQYKCMHLNVLFYFVFRLLFHF